MKTLIIGSKSLLLILCLAIIVLSCKKDEDREPFPTPDHERGEILEATSMGIYSLDDIQRLADESIEDNQFVLYHSVEVFSVEYYSVDNEGTDILVSGALYVPQFRGAMPMISIQHGTVLQHDNVASVSPDNTTEGKIGLMTASMGYLSLLPDYPGFGASTQNHPYLHAASIVPSVVDFILAGQQYCEDNSIILKDGLYMTGYSEGGYISLATQKVIEESYSNKIELKAVAPLSGPYDMFGTFDKIFCDDNYCSPAYVAYVLKSYNDVYKWNRLGSFFKPRYAKAMHELFDGTMPWWKVEKLLPDTLSEMMHPDFVANYHNNGSVVDKAFKENTILDWTPQAPIHFYHGDCDDIVFCMNANNARDRLIANGAQDVQLTILSGKNHETAGPFAIAAALSWIEDFQPDQ